VLRVKTVNLTHYLSLGRRIRVILFAICCDHPALCRVCGFADHKHKRRFCTKCKIEHKDLKTEAGMMNGMSSYLLVRFH
jgi:hypothetical protein